MKVKAIALAILAIVVVGLTLGAAQLGLAPLSTLFTDALPLTKIADLILLALVVVVVVLGMSAASKAERGSSLVATMVWLAPLAGFGAFAKDAMIIWIVVQRTGTTNPRVVAPSVGAALLPLSLGLLIGLVAAILAARRSLAAKAP